MPSEQMEFSEMGKYSSETNLTNGKHRNGGCYVSIAVGFLMVLLAIAIAVGVGIIVHFAGPGRTVICQCPSENGKEPLDPAAVKGECKKQILAGDKEVCRVCPGGPDTPSTTAAPKTTKQPMTTKPPKVTDVRIPRDLEPIYYDIELQPHMYDGDPKAFTFNGKVRIQLKCMVPTNKVILQMKKLNITEGTMSFGAQDGSAAPSIRSNEYDKDREFLVLNLSDMLQKDKLYYVMMDYVGPLKEDLVGLYLSKYKRNNETVYMATTQFQPTDARKAFPCFDEPAIKAYFNITLVRKKHLTAISNMPVARSDNRADDWVADVFESTPKMPTYLLAFIISDFKYTNMTTKYNVLYRAWARPESLSQTTYALDTGVKILTYFEDYFDIKFPLPKQDMIAVPDFQAGAMENWGLITYRETAMLYEPGVSSEGNKQRVAVVVSHELAHQWFGDLVTPSWWDDLWLNEGFASFVEYMGVDHVHPDWKMFEQFVVEDLQSVFNFDSLVTSHPVYVPVAHPDEINEIFDRISYAKGASIIRMMRFFLGEETFRKGLTEYLRSKAYAAAFHDDLWASLTAQAVSEGKQINVKSIMDTWTLQMNYPTVSVKREGTGIRISQARYLKDPTATDPMKYKSKFGYKWDIPFTYTSNADNNFNKTDSDITWLKRGDPNKLISSVTLGAGTDAWVIGNVMQYGYYRVNYEESNWMALINQLKADHTKIHPINRAQIINDAWNLAIPGLLKQEIALKTVEYLDKEMDYVPRVAANKELKYVDTMLTKTGLYGAFEKFMRKTVDTPFKQIGMNNTGASHLESYMRSTLAGHACTYGIKECIDKSRELYRFWMNNSDNNPIDPGLKATVYCTAIKHGGVDEWDFGYKQYKMATVAAEKARILGSLSCSREPWILSRLLKRALTPSEIRKQDALGIISSVSRNAVGNSLAWDFFRNRWSDIRKDYGASFFAFTSLIGTVTQPFNTDFDLQQVKSFIATHPDTGSGTRAFAQAVEKTQVNIKWMKNNYMVVEKWLTDLGYHKM